MIRLFRWIFGYVEFEYKNGLIEEFLNTCYSYGIGIFNIKSTNDRLIACCPAKKYKKLHLVAKQNAGTIKILKKHGLTMPFLKLKNRLGLIVGGLLFVTIISFFSGFIWDIQIQGNNEIRGSEIINVLQQNNFTIGSRWDNIDKGSVESMLMASVDKCSWVSINRQGCTAVVEINEGVEKPKIVDKQYCNVKATKDGIITNAIVYNGWKVANIGDGVTKGDLLISGIYQGQDTKVTLFADAKGDYTAQVKEKINLTVSRYQKEKFYEKSKKYKSICFYGLTIPLYFNKISKNNTDISKEYEYLQLNNKQLPIGILTTTVKKYTISEKCLNDNELITLTKEKISDYVKNDLNNCEIISDHTQIQLFEANGKITGYLICIENICETVPIYIKDEGE